MFVNKKMVSTMKMHDVAFNLNSSSLAFVGCGSSNNIDNLQVEGNEKQGLENTNGDEVHDTYLKCAWRS
jgi:hypothetical protein